MPKDRVCIHGHACKRGVKCDTCASINSKKSRQKAYEDTEKRAKTLAYHRAWRQTPKGRAMVKAITRRRMLARQKAAKGKKKRFASNQTWIRGARSLLKRFVACWTGQDNRGYSLKKDKLPELHEIRSAAVVLVSMTVQKRKLRTNVVYRFRDGK